MINLFKIKNKASDAIKFYGLVRFKVDFMKINPLNYIRQGIVLLCVIVTILTGGAGSSAANIQANSNESQQNSRKSGDSVFIKESKGTQTMPVGYDADEAGGFFLRGLLVLVILVLFVGYTISKRH